MRTYEHTIMENKHEHEKVDSILTRGEHAIEGVGVLETGIAESEMRHFSGVSV